MKRMLALFFYLFFALGEISCAAGTGTGQVTATPAPPQETPGITDTLTELTPAGDKEVNNTEPSSAVGIFDFENRRVLLNSGYYMPLTGLGTYALQDDVCIASVTALLENGGRLIDTASMYGTEDSVGEAVRNSQVPREEIFVTTKLYPNQFVNAAEATQRSFLAIR